MQTFMPYPGFSDSLLCLDYRRLGKQRVEAKQLITAVVAPQTTGWANHPAARMWFGYVGALKLYHDLAILTWVNRGYRNNMEYFNPPEDSIVLPPWLGDQAFHDSHKSNLLRKAPDYYGQFGWQVPSDLPYIWPNPKDYETA